MPFFQYRNSKIYYEVTGKGKEPLLFFHEWNTSSRLFKRINYRYYKENYQVILFDFPGFGKSEKLEIMTYPEITRMVNELLEFLNIPKINLMGLCMGGIFAMEFTLKYPVKVKKIAVIELFLEYPFILKLGLIPVVRDILYYMTTRSPFGKFVFIKLMWGNEIYKYTRYFFNVVHHSSENIAVDYLKISYQYAKNINHYERIKKISPEKILHIYGGRTVGMLKKLIRKVVRYYPEWESVKLADSKHFLLFEKPYETYEIVDSFMRNYPE